MTYHLRIYTKDGLYIATHLLQEEKKAKKVFDDYIKLGLRVTLTEIGGAWKSTRR